MYQSDAFTPVTMAETLANVQIVTVLPPLSPWEMVTNPIPERSIEVTIPTGTQTQE